jgi:hypothetical protein
LVEGDVGIMLDARVVVEVVVGRVVVAVDPGVGLSAAEVVVSWEADEQARAVSSAVVESARGGEFLPGLVELIVIPGAVNLATSALYDLVGRVVRRSRPDRGELLELELVETTTALGDRVVVVRSRRERS